MDRHEEVESWVTIIDRLLQLSNILPTLSNSSRRAIICIIILVLIWKMLIWTFELVLTAACFLLLVIVLLSFFMPDTSVWVLTQVLPPYVEGVRHWLSQVFLNVGQSLSIPSRTPTPPTSENIPLTPSSHKETPT